MVQVEMHDPGQGGGVPPVPVQAAASSPAPPPGKPDERAVTLPDGRVVVWKQLGMLNQMRFAEITPASVREDTWWRYIAMTAYSVVSIDGVPEPKPASKVQLEALVQRLTDEGMEALMKDSEAVARARDAGPEDDPMARARK